MSETNGTPAADVAAVRDEWVAAVTELVARVEGWCDEPDWATRRGVKLITDETDLGPYRVPQLLIQWWDTKLLLEPVGRQIVGADGRVDLYTMPEYDDLAVLLLRGGDWRVRVQLGKERRDEVPLTRESFRDVIETFARRHAEA